VAKTLLTFLPKVSVILILLRFPDSCGINKVHLLPNKAGMENKKPVFHNYSSGDCA
tara:strand:+ start:49 stop:216 length:168 start_codon:yes stop_codon:yes gene_type:complete